MKVVEVKCKIWKTKETKTHLIQFKLLIFYKPTCLQKNFHRRILSIWAFSADGNFGLIVSLRGWTLSHHVSDQFKPIKIGENLVVNYITADSPRMNTITSRDQFKPIKIGENLVTNYNVW